jgi:hypothetical protein
MDLRLLRREVERRIREKEAYFNEGQVNHPYQAKKRAQSASTGNGWRPQPRFCKSRLRLCPAARRSVSQFTRPVPS